MHALLAIPRFLIVNFFPFFVLGQLAIPSIIIGIANGSTVAIVVAAICFIRMKGGGGQQVVNQRMVRGG